MSDLPIHTIDLNFKGRRGTIGTYLVPHSAGCILVETGPGSTTDALLAGMGDYGFHVADVTDVFLTHIHLDHAGAAGWWAKQGALVHVHEFGAPHLLNPEKLLSSAQRLYGDLMGPLWGDFLPIPENKLSIMLDGDEYSVGDITIHALDVPGHANHHLAFMIEDACFTGDIGGIRLTPRKYLTVPMPPPEFQLEKWRESIHRIMQHNPRRVVPTHFGVYDDADWHLNAVLIELDQVEAWIERIMPTNPTLEELRQQFIEFDRFRAEKNGISAELAQAQQIANPTFMSADGIMRYWNKYRKPISPV